MTAQPVGSLGALVALLGVLVTGATSACHFDPTHRAMRDRLAVETVVYSYANHYDAGRFNEFLGLFWEDATVQFHPAEPGGLESLAEVARERGAAFVASGVQRRHLMTNLVIHSLTRQTATGEFYLLLTSTAHGQLHPIATGRYVFTMAQRGGEWRIQDWQVFLDGNTD